jgi:hypothetical protein
LVIGQKQFLVMMDTGAFRHTHYLIPDLEEITMMSLRDEQQGTVRDKKQGASKRSVLRYLALGLLTLGGMNMAVADGEMSAEQKAKMEKVQQMMQAEMQLMQPDLQKQISALSKVTKQAIAKIYSQHTRRSSSLTLRQVMHEVQSDYQSTATGILTDNYEQASDSARRLANHRLPRGGLLPYLKAEHVTDEMLGVLVPFNDSVEGNALRLAEAADKGNMSVAAEYFGKITSGCVACHQVFRGQPGMSPRLR